MTLNEEFKIIKKFEKKNQSIFTEGKPFNKYRSKKIIYRSKEHLKILKERFMNDRPEIRDKLKLDKSKKNVVPDRAIYEYIKEKHSFTEENTELVKSYHNIAMDAENRFGYYLEEFIYSKIKLENWVWCTGSILRSIDFIKENKDDKKDPWIMLQIKNSDNSENSSSSKVRKGTNIKKWFRRFSMRDATNWEKLIEITENKDLSEENFLEFLRGKAKN